MKKIIIYSAMALATSLGMSSCGDNFLKLDPTGSVSEGTLMTEEGIDWVLTGAYASFNGMTQTGWMGYASLANYVYGDVMGADANKGSIANDQTDFTQLETYSFNSSNGYISGKWNGIYEAVKRCNNVMSMVNRYGDGLTNAEQIIGQAQFIKAVWLFDGIKNFGASIPYVSVEDYEANTDPQVTNIDEGGNYIYIWDKVEADLKDAINKLPATWPANESGRATSWMAKAVLAKLYIFWSSPYNGNNGSGTNHWGDAKALLQEIINNGVDAKGNKYQLIKNYGDLFDATSADCDWGGEGVFDVQLTIAGTQTNTNAPVSNPAIGPQGLGGWGFYQPTYDFVQNFIVDANGLPLSAKEYRAKPVLSKVKAGTSDGVETDLTVAVDPRLDFAIGRFGIPFMDYGVPLKTGGWVRDPTNGGLYMNKKYLPQKSEKGSTSVATASVSSSKNLHLIRFADILLMYAECLIHDGQFDEAISYINQVRSRAANDIYTVAEFEDVYKASVDEEKGEKWTDIAPSGLKFENKTNNGSDVNETVSNYRLGLYPTSGNTEATATAALRAERRIELSLEGHRWYDLCRWGIASTELNDYVSYENNFFGTKFQAYGGYVMLPIPFTEIAYAQGRIVQNADWK